MQTWTKAAARRTIITLLIGAFLTVSWAADIAVHPFSSENPHFGVAVAEEIAASFANSAVVYGPEVASGLVPPLVVSDGFINLGRVLDANDWTGPAGAELIRSGAGVDVAVTGTIEQYNDRTVLLLEIAHPSGTRRAQLNADPGDRERLVRQAVRLITPHLRLDSPPESVATPELTGDYASYMNAVLLAASGFVAEARDVERGEDGSWPERADELMQDLTLAVGGGELPTAETAGGENTAGRRLARVALLSLSLPSFNEETAVSGWEEFYELTRAPVALAWQGVLHASVGANEAATTAFTRSKNLGFHYAEVLLASLEEATGERDAALSRLDAVTTRGTSAGSASLLAASLVAYLMDDVPRQAKALTELARASPYLTYPHQELSFIAFDADDALMAAEALTVAVQLDPESTLYWTNLGWARYLLGFLEGSEEASIRALELDSGQYIAAYNLGLVRVVTGRMASALEAYDHAVALDPSVHDAVIEDLEDARTLYPKESGVEYALARLLEVKGHRADARAAYERFVRLAKTTGAEEEYAPYLQVAIERIEVLSAPPPPLEILGTLALRLGQRGPSGEPFSPGDPVHPVFELSTPGDQLPALVNVHVTLHGEGETPVAEGDYEVRPPAGAVGYVVDFIEFELPPDLPAATYALTVEASAGEELADTITTDVEVRGEPSPLRQLLARNVVMTGLEVELPLYSQNDLNNLERVIGRMLQELEEAAPVAEEALEPIVRGRFAGMSGSELFLSATADDVEEFLVYVAATRVRNSGFTFVDGYAQWAIDGAPAAPAGAE